MLRVIRTALLGAALFASPACAQAPRPAPMAQTETLAVTVGGARREVILDTPLPAPDAPAPLVLIFHGGGGSAQWMRQRSADLARTLREQGYAVAFMNGSSKRGTRKLRTWNAGHCCSWALEAGVDDVAYVDAAVSTIAAATRIDPSRIYLFGHSNGAMLSYRIAGELAVRPRGVVAISGAIFADQTPFPKGTSLFAVHTADDDVLSIAGDPDDKARRWRDAPILPYADLQKKMAGWMACADVAESAPAPYVARREQACADDARFVAVTAMRGGHEWPKRIPGYDLDGDIVAFLNAGR